ncbi:hypothetical protein C8R43DRAFT_1013876 [Mycena crocata]|nr:hypothetical protein C8R43DRAFT_1013876 [Mycena crocata]
MDIPLPTPTHDSTRISHSHSHSRRDTSPLLTLPPELLALLALHLATRPPNLGPPAALLPLLLTCRFLYSQLGFPYTRGRGNAALWARIGRAKFARGSIVASGDGVGDEPLSESLPRSIFGDVSRTGMETSPSTSRRMSTTTSKTERAATRFRTLLTALRDIRAGDVHDPRAGWALVVAYGMVVEDDLDAEGEGDSDDPHGTVKAEGNKTMPALSMEASGAWREGGMEGLRMREAAEAASSSTIITEVVGCGRGLGAPEDFRELYFPFDADASLFFFFASPCFVCFIPLFYSFLFYYSHTPSNKFLPQSLPLPSDISILPVFDLC